MRLQGGSSGWGGAWVILDEACRARPGAPREFRSQLRFLWRQDHGLKPHSTPWGAHLETVGALPSFSGRNPPTGTCPPPESWGRRAQGSVGFTGQRSGRLLHVLPPPPETLRWELQADFGQ